MNVYSVDKNIILAALPDIATGNYDNCRMQLMQAQKESVKENKTEKCAICLSLLGLLDYVSTKERYLTALEQLNDAQFLATQVKGEWALMLIELILGYINFAEKNNELSTLHYNNAKKYANILGNTSEVNSIMSEFEKIPQGMNFYAASKKDPLLALMKIGQAVAAETDINVLLKVIAEETKMAIQADRCTVFLYDKEKNELWSKVALGLDTTEIRFPADRGLAGHVVKTGETINITDAYNDDRFNKDIDLQTGYRTRNILCMPIKNLNQEIIGAFQVLNKVNGTFNEEDEDLLVAIGSSAGISLENAQLFQQQLEMYEEQKVVFDSFIETLAASIDARDKITAGHSSRVRMYSSLIANAFELPAKDIEIIEKAATLHDIGKIGIRDSVLQKDGKLTDEEYKHIQEHVEITHNILEKIHMSDEFKMVTEIACSHHEKWNGSGYYRHLAGEEIPFGGRILAVSDVFDAITSKRHYRDKMPIGRVIDILIKDSGSHFDKCIVDKFLAISLDKIIEIFLTENHMFLDDKDRELMSMYNLQNLYDFIQNNTNENIVSKFNFYYLGVLNED